MNLVDDLMHEALELKERVAQLEDVLALVQQRAEMPEWLVMAVQTVLGEQEDDER